MELGKSVEHYLVTNIFYILPTALAWVFFIEIFKQILRDRGYIDIGVKYLEKLFSRNREAAAFSAILFLGIAYMTLFRQSSSTLFDVYMIVSVGVLSISLFIATRLSGWTANLLGTSLWVETAFTAWMLMVFALFIVFSTLVLINRLFPTMLV